MTHVVIPEPEIKLYEDGFNDHDILMRKPTGETLSELLEKIENPLVIALDGAWGSGKSFFLKCWVGEHLKREGNKTRTVYFDAFKHDYLDDPLISLTGAVTERFWTPEDEQQEQNQIKIQKFKKVALAVGKATGRIGLSLATIGATKILEDLGDEIVKLTNQEAMKLLNKYECNVEVDKFWNAHHAKINAMEDFRIALRSLTKSENNEWNKLVIVVDELDRCRPDYALSLLEIIKHFFNVDGVHFVLGLNLSGVENSVRARYGNDVDATTYLQKFYSFIIRLPEKVEYHQDYLCYCRDILKSKSIQIDDLFHDTIEMYLKIYNFETAPMSLRMIQKILTVISLIPYKKFRNEKCTIDVSVVICAAFMKVCAPDIYRKMCQNKMTIDDLEKVFNLDTYILRIWDEIFSSGVDHTFDVDNKKNSKYGKDHIQNICEDYLEVFDICALLS